MDTMNSFDNLELNVSQVKAYKIMVWQITEKGKRRLQISGMINRDSENGDSNYGNYLVLDRQKRAIHYCNLSSMKIIN